MGVQNRLVNMVDAVKCCHMLKNAFREQEREIGGCNKIGAGAKYSERRPVITLNKGLFIYAIQRSFSHGFYFSK